MIKEFLVNFIGGFGISLFFIFLVFCCVTPLKTIGIIFSLLLMGIAVVVE